MPISTIPVKNQARLAHKHVGFPNFYCICQNIRYMYHVAKP